jgi:sugar phosphate isomerase/epimerase
LLPAAAGARARIGRGRISAISDEIAMSPEESVAFAHHFGLDWLELRDVPGLPLTAEILSQRAAIAQQEYDQRFANLAKCIQSAHAFECPYLRVFSFLRAEHPESLYDRIANIIGEMAQKAQAEGVLLLIENEPACNAGNNADLAAFLPKVPEKLLGFNWDPRNAQIKGAFSPGDGQDRQARGCQRASRPRFLT